MNKTRAAFDAALAKQKGVGGAAVSVQVDGQERFSAFGGEARPGVPWTKDTRVVTMSIAKGWVGLVAAMLADRGLLDPDERVATYWPEYATAGKQDTLVRDFYLHSAGALGFNRVADVLRWDGGGWSDLDGIAAGLAAADPAWPPGTRAGYHAVTYGWLVGELVRRVDGRTVGQLFRDEVAAPLGIRSAIGVPEAEQGDIARVHAEGMDRSTFPIGLVLKGSRKKMRDPSTLIGRASLGDGEVSIFDTPGDLMNNAWFLEAEVPASNGVTSAHDLARLFAAVARGGELDGVRLLSSDGLARFTAPIPSAATDVVLQSGMPKLLAGVLGSMFKANRSLGFMANDPTTGPQGLGKGPRTVGAGGYGGQLVLADPDNRLSMAFVRSALLPTDKEIKQLVAAVYDDLS